MTTIIGRKFEINIWNDAKEVYGIMECMILDKLEGDKYLVEIYPVDKDSNQEPKVDIVSADQIYKMIHE